MIWQLALIVAAIAWGAPVHAETSLQELARRAISDGIPNRLPGPIADLIDLPADAPVHLLEIPRAQTHDATNHTFAVLVELSTGTPRRPLGPIGLVFSTRRVADGGSDSRWFRANLQGTTERAIRIRGRAGVKGSGTATKEEVETPEVKAAFQHELDLWLKRRYLKKEWRSAEFSNGELKKKGKLR